MTPLAKKLAQLKATNNGPKTGKDAGHRPPDKKFPLDKLIYLYIYSDRYSLYINNFEVLKYLITNLGPIDTDIQVPDSYWQWFNRNQRLLINYDMQEIAKILNCDQAVISYIVSTL